MQLTPSYGPDPIIVLDGPPPAAFEPLARQRRRLAQQLAGFAPEQWAHPTRCDAWSARDVVIHLDTTNTFWCFSIGSALAGEPTRFLSTFDPVASPARFVADAGDVSPDEVLARFTTSTEAFLELLAGLDDAGWGTLAETPVGHVSVAALAHHALWDGWVHERDILLPQGLSPVVEPDEVAASLRFAAVLGAAFGITAGVEGRGRLGVAATEPAVDFVVDITDRATLGEGDHGEADLCLAGDAVELLEALSLRRPLDQPVPADAAWMLAGLAEVFDQPPPVA